MGDRARELEHGKGDGRLVRVKAERDTGREPELGVHLPKKERSEVRAWRGLGSSRVDRRRWTPPGRPTSSAFPPTCSGELLENVVPGSARVGAP